MKTKTCTQCGTEKNTDQFSPHILGIFGVGTSCKECRNKYNKEYYIKNKKKMNEYNKEYRSENKDYFSEKNRDYQEKYKQEHEGASRGGVQQRKIRQQVLDGYGRKCACCGETREQFLALDHVNGGGNKKMKAKGTREHYFDAIKRNFPSDYRILCHNCNFSIGHYGFCPHEK